MADPTGVAGAGRRRRKSAKDRHISRKTVLRFMRDKLSREEIRDAVRHLLTGCPKCGARAYALWHLAATRAFRMTGGWDKGLPPPWP